MKQETLQKIELSRIQPFNNVRKTFNEVEVNELAESIKNVGLINPITVRPLSEFAGLISGEKFEIVAGEKRFRACKQAQLDSILAIVKNLTDSEVLEIQIIENLQRSDVHPLDEAEGFDRLIKSGKYTKETMAEKVGKSSSYVIKRIQLLKLEDKIQKAFYENKFSLGHAIELARLNPDQQKKAYKWMEDWPGGGYPLGNLKDRIQHEFHLDLSKAVFDTKDENLLKGVLSCFNCSKRTGYNTGLFEDIENKDTCTDPKCHGMKVQAHLDSKIASYEKKGKTLQKISTEYTGKKENVLYSGNYSIIDKKDVACDSTVDAIVTENPFTWNTDKPLGKILRICADKKCKVHHGSNSYSRPEMTAKEKKEAAEYELKRKVDEQLGKVVLNKLISKISWPLSSDLFLDLFNYIMETGSLASDDYLKNHDIDYPDSYGADDEKVKELFIKADDNERIKILFEMIYMGDIPYRLENLEPILKRYKLSLKTLRAPIEKELKEEKAEKAADKTKNKSKKKTK